MHMTKLTYPIRFSEKAKSIGWLLMRGPPLLMNRHTLRAVLVKVAQAIPPPAVMMADAEKGRAQHPYRVEFPYLFSGQKNTARKH